MEPRFVFGIFLGRWVHWSPPAATATVKWIDAIRPAWLLSNDTRLPLHGANQHPLLARLQLFLSAAMDVDAPPFVWRCFVSPCTRDTLFISVSDPVAARCLEKTGALPCESELSALLSAARDHQAFRLTTLDTLRPAAPNLAAPAPSAWPPQVATAWFDERALQWRPNPARPHVSRQDASLVGARLGADMQEVLDSGLMREALASVPESGVGLRTVGVDSETLRTVLALPTILVLDPDAPYQDTRVLTPRALVSMTVFRLAPRDYEAWLRTPDVDDTADGRKRLHRATTNLSVAVPPHAIEWRAVVHAAECTLPVTAQRRILVDTSGLTFTARRVLPWIAPSVSIDDTRAWVIPFSHVLTLQLYMTTPNGWERRPRAPRDAHMAAFGIGKTASGAWSSHAFWHSALKRPIDFSLHRAHVDACFDGFAREQALAVSSDAPPQCAVCCDAPCGVLLDACGHAFCIGCTTRMLEFSAPGDDARCAVCRAPFSAHSRTWIRKQGRSDPRPVLSRQTAIERVTRRIPSTLVVFADDETWGAGRGWVTNADAVVHVLGAELPARQFDKIVFTWGWMGAGATACADTHACVHRVVQRCAAPNATLVVLCDTSEEDASGLLEWTREFASVYTRMSVTSKYARDEDVE